MLLTLYLIRWSLVYVLMKSQCQHECYCQTVYYQLNYSVFLFFVFVCVVSHSQEQHHQTAGRKPAAEEWKHPNCAEDTTTFRGTQSHMHTHKSHHCLKTDENFQMVHPAFNISTIIPRTYYKLMHDTADIDVINLGNPGRCVSGERHVQTVSSGFGWDVQRCSKATEGGVSAQTGQTAPDCVFVFNFLYWV